MFVGSVAFRKLEDQSGNLEREKPNPFRLQTERNTLSTRQVKNQK